MERPYPVSSWIGTTSVGAHIRSCLRVVVAAVVPFLFIAPATAQVVIEERITLGEQDEAKGAFTVTFTAQTDGDLSVGFGFITRAGTPYPTDGTVRLKTYVNGVLIDDADVFASPWNLDQTFRQCQGDGQTYDVNYYGIDPTEYVSPGSVVANDVVAFVWETDLDTYGDGASEGEVAGPNADGIYQGVIGHFDPFCNYFTESLRFTAQVSGPELDFIRQDNSTFPESGSGARLMVSKAVTNVDLPDNATFIGPTGSDPETFRGQLTELDAGLEEDVEFTIEIFRGGSSVGSVHTYGAREGTIDGEPVYRTDEHIRLVSNATPSTGASGSYDDGVRGDQTLRVELGDIVRMTAKVSGSTVATSELPVGRPPAENGPDAIRVADVRVVTLKNQTSDPHIIVERASEDWAQAAIRFDNTHARSGVDPQDNTISLRNSPVSDGKLKVEVSAGGFTGASGLAEVEFTAGEPERAIAQRLAAEISAIVFQGYNPFTAFEADFGTTYANVVVNQGSGVDIVVKVNTDPNLIVAPWSFNYSTDPYTFEMIEVLGLNFGDVDMSTIDVFVVPPSATPGLRAQAFPEEQYAALDFPGARNTILLTTPFATSNDAYGPYVLGHEIGHILLDGEYDVSDEDGHVGTATNLMYTPTTQPESVGGSKRLTTLQASTVRLESGLGATPAILHR